MSESYIEEIARMEAETFGDAWSEKTLYETFNYEYNRYLVMDTLGNIYRKPGSGETEGFGGGTSVYAGYVIYSVVAGEAELLRIAVSPEFRRKGFGRRLMEAFTDDLAGEAESIYLEVRAGNEPAKLLYQSMGFENMGVRKNYYSSPDEDAVIMSKTLV